MELEEIILCHQRFYPTDFRLHLVEGAPAAELRGMRIHQMMLHEEVGDAMPLSNPVEWVLAHPDVRKMVDNEKVDPNEWRLPVEIKFDKGTFIRGASGAEVGLLSLGFTVHCRQSNTSVQLQYGALAGSNIAFGTAETGAGQVVVSIAEKGDGRATLALKVVSSSKNADSGKFLEVRKGKFVKPTVA
jgi:hypothetical protein